MVLLARGSREENKEIAIGESGKEILYAADDRDVLEKVGCVCGEIPDLELLFKLLISSLLCVRGVVIGKHGLLANGIAHNFDGVTES